MTNAGARPGAPGDALIERDGAFLFFRDPQAVLTARRPEEVLPLLREVEAAVARGRHAAGFVAYEAAPAFDPALRTHPPGRLPLAWFGLYGEPQARPLDAWAGEPVPPPAWTPTLGRADYARAIARIKDLIAAGDTYQV